MKKNKMAVIFDMDGVISDTQRWHAQIESKLLDELGVKISPEKITATYAGIEDRRWIDEILQEKNLKISLDNIIKKKWRLESEMIEKEGVTEIEGSIDLIKELARSEFSLAVASSSPIHFIKAILNNLNISSFFSVICSADEVLHGKPAPEIFLLAAARLNVEPRYSVVIEDGRSGILGAQKAGMKTIGLVPNKNKSDFPANILIESMKEISPESIKALLNGQ
jgi:HAD superfamily hydrolase (TIGR01509 family)